MNSILERIYETSRVEDAEGNLINPFPVATPRETGTILYELIQEYRCEKTLEIGLAYGLSTLFICQAHRDKTGGTHIAIDPKQTKLWKSIGLLNIKKAGLEEYFRFFESPSYEVLPKLLLEGEKFDFAFIDGSHFFDYTLVDFFYIDKLLPVGKYVLFDDIWMPGIRKVLHYILRNRNYEIVKLKRESNFSEYVKTIISRSWQNPFERDYGGIKFLPNNICLLKKISEDKRDWRFHRSF
jgi:predicted O-methyltransferase YrrM